MRNLRIPFNHKSIIRINCIIILLNMKNTLISLIYDRIFMHLKFLINLSFYPLYELNQYNTILFLHNGHALLLTTHNLIQSL